MEVLWRLHPRIILVRTAQLAGVNHVVLTGEDKDLAIPSALRHERRDESLLEKLLGTEEWQRVLARREPIQRVWGPVGLFWSLLLDAIKEGADFVLREVWKADLWQTRKKILLAHRRERLRQG